MKLLVCANRLHCKTRVEQVCCECCNYDRLCDAYHRVSWHGECKHCSGLVRHSTYNFAVQGVRGFSNRISLVMMRFMLNGIAFSVFLFLFRCHMHGCRVAGITDEACPLCSSKLWPAASCRLVELVCSDSQSIKPAHYCITLNQNYKPVPELWSLCACPSGCNSCNQWKAAAKTVQHHCKPDWL